MDMVTVTGTENLMMAACWPRATTLLENAAREPEVVDLAQLPDRDGREDRRRRHRRDPRSRACASLHGATHRVMPDRIETGTYPRRRGRGRRRRAPRRAPRRESLDATLDKLREAGARICARGDDWIELEIGAAPAARSSVRTAPYPGFADRHAGAVHGARTASPTAPRVITETIFENRFMHVQELQRLGADIAHRGQYRGGAAASSGCRARP